MKLAVAAGASVSIEAPQIEIGKAATAYYLYPDIIYPQQRGLNAIGAGGITGQGLFKGAYTQAGAVPESQNDMIFSVVGE